MRSVLMRETEKTSSEESSDTAKDIKDIKGIKDSIVREYILKLPVCRTEFTKEGR